MASKWKKIKKMLSKRLRLIAPSTQEARSDHDDRRGNADDAWIAARGHSQPLSKSCARKMSRGASFGGYNARPAINADANHEYMQSAPITSVPSFSGPIPGCPNRANGFPLPRSTCSICLESMKPGQGQALFTAECSHSFHFSCIASNVRYGNQICPICRAKWKDLPWQAVSEGSKSQKGRNNSFRRTASNSSREVNVSRSDTFSDSRYEHASLNFSLQYLDESTLNGLIFPREPNVYDDDDPIHQPRISDSRSVCTNPSSCGQKLHLKMFAEVSAVPHHESREFFTVLVHLKAPAASIMNIDEGCGSHSRVTARAPLDLVAVLDISGSMAGRKLSLLKQAMGFVIHNLSAADRLSVVVFSSTARRIFPLRKMGEDGQRQALQAVDALVATGGTNIAEGLQKGLKVLKECKENNSVSSIILLSDGQDTFHMNSSRRQLPFFSSRGASDIQRLVPRCIRHSASSGRMQIPVHTFGFGSDHDAPTMHTISEVSGGTFSYVQAEEVVQDAFAQCIGGLLSVVAQDVQLTISCSTPGVFISDIHSGSYGNSILDSAQHGNVKLGDLYAEEERDVLVDLKLPSLSKSEESGPMSVLEAVCIYKDPLKQEVIQNIADELSIMRPIMVDKGHQLVSLEVDRQRNRLRTVESIAEARVLADQGNIEAAQCGLRNARTQLGASPSARAGDHLCRVLESELSEIEERMANRQLYERSGRAYLLSAQSSHLRQRATTRGDSLECMMHDYQTPSMVDMVSLSQTSLTPEAYASGFPHHSMNRDRSSTNRSVPSKGCIRFQKAE